MTGTSYNKTISREEHPIVGVTLPPETERPRPYVSNSTYFSKWSNNMAYLLGYLIADGSVSKGKYGSYRLHLVTCDKDIMDFIRNEIGSTYAVTVQAPKKSTHNICYRSSIACDEMIMDLMSLGVVPNKTTNPILPEIPSEYLPDFIRGFFDGDGSVTYGHYGNYSDRLIIDMISYSKEFLQKLGNLLKDAIGIIPKVYKHGNNFTLRYGCKESVALYRYMYKDSFGLNRKLEKFESFLQKKGIDWLLRSCNICEKKFTVTHDKSHRCWNCKKELKYMEQDTVQSTV